MKHVRFLDWPAAYIRRRTADKLCGGAHDVLQTVFERLRDGAYDHPLDGAFDRVPLTLMDEIDRIKKDLVKLQEVVRRASLSVSEEQHCQEVIGWMIQQLGFLNAARNKTTFSYLLKVQFGRAGSVRRVAGLLTYYICYTEFNNRPIPRVVVWEVTGALQKDPLLE